MKMTRAEFDLILQDAKKWRALTKELDRLCTFAGNKSTMGKMIELVERIKKDGDMSNI